jgi:hypothetical protein
MFIQLSNGPLKAQERVSGLRACLDSRTRLGCSSLDVECAFTSALVVVSEEAADEGICESRPGTIVSSRMTKKLARN